MVKASANWAKLSDEKLLDLRFMDLKLKIEGTDLESEIERLRSELQAQELLFEPYFYLGDEWFSPDGIPAVAIPFYLAHPRLIELEKSILLEAEGSRPNECIKFIRHETGHAISHAYQLTRLPKFRKTFGDPNQPYSPEYYTLRPYSKNYVQNLENGYAQAHPEEDFAETFAVWLNPESQWKEKYKGWGALKKLQVVDQLMNTYRTRPPKVQELDTPFDIQRSRTKLRTYYERKRKEYASDFPDFYDPDLLKLFEKARDRRSLRAYRFLQTNRSLIIHKVSYWTTARKYTVNKLLRLFIQRAKELDLCVKQNHDQSLLDVIAFLCTLMNTYQITGSYK